MPQSIIPRDIQVELKKAAREYPAVALLGPRQAGKTTVLKQTFPEYNYVLLEDPDKLEFALSDPRGFLNFYRNEQGLIIDEVQNAPLLFSYLQGIIDAENRPGLFILSGSQNFYLNEQISQTLAGRIAILTQLPLSLSEIKASGALPNTYEALIFQGQYPRLYANEMDTHKWYTNYVRTYIERDVRQIKNITDLHLFQKFLGLCAGRIGQVVNWSQLANDCGISTQTVTSWISLLQASYLIFLLYPYHNNFNKRLIKSPKLYFYDTGVACALLRIDSTIQLATHYLKGALFESYVIADLMKREYNQGRVPHLYFWRDQSDREVDCLLESGTHTFPLEIKSSETINTKFFDNLLYWNKLAHQDPSQGYVIYGGREKQERSFGKVIGWDSIDEL